MPARKRSPKGALARAELSHLDKLIEAARERGFDLGDRLDQDEEEQRRAAAEARQERMAEQAEARAELAAERAERRHGGIVIEEKELAALERMNELVGRLQPAPTLGELVALREELQQGI